jgi:hypothetical protein
LIGFPHSYLEFAILSGQRVFLRRLEVVKYSLGYVDFEKPGFHLFPKGKKEVLNYKNECKRTSYSLIDDQ